MTKSTRSGNRDSRPPEPSAEFRWVDPEQAREWLSTNHSNRSLREAHVERLKRDIQRGHWKVNGEAVQFDTSGLLTNGQHRLTAIERADEGAWLLVVSGVEREAQITMDTGMKRSFADHLRMLGEPNHVPLAASTRAYWELCNGQLRVNSSDATHEDYLETLKENPGLRRSVEKTKGITKLKAKQSVMAMTHYVFAQIDRDEADAFFDRLIMGTGFSSEDDPIRRLRESLPRLKKESPQAERMRTYVYTIKAWNAYVAGDPVGQLRWRSGGQNPEPVPEPLDPNED